jgi:hypothetical protein
MQRLEAIKSSSANSFPELPGRNNNTSQIVEVSFSANSWSTREVTNVSERMNLETNETPLATAGAESPAPPESTLANVSLSSPEFDVVRSIRVWHVRHYSYKVREREGPCETRLDMDVGTYDDNASFSWSDRAPGPRPSWLPLHRQCPNYYRGVGVEWSDSFGRYGYMLASY